MSSSSSSSSFKEAAAYLSNSSHLSKVSNDVKLELYALYKCITVSRRPLTPRPALFDFTSRAKWDAWDKLGKDLEHDEKDWVNRYLEIARSFGWREGEGSVAVHNSDSENVAASGRNSKSNEKGGTGTGRHVSVLSAPDWSAEDTLHGRVLENDVIKVKALFDADPPVDVNVRDEYGYTPLHLAADRGYKDIVTVLLEKGADITIRDSDDYTAFDLADLAGHKEIRDMLA